MPNYAWLLTGVVYAAAVWLARRGGVELPRRIAFFFYALVLLFLWAPLTSDVAGLPIDFLKVLPPWNATTRDFHLQNPQLNDITLQIVPWAHQVRESWRALHVPLWNHFSSSGYPLLASGQSSALSPLRLLALPLSLAHAMAAEAAMKLLVALTFTFLFCRKRGYGELASVIGAIAFGFCTFLVVWLHFPMATSACFLPAVLYCLELLIERRTYARFVAAAVVWTVMLFGGHPETASHAFFLAVLYLAWILVIERPFSWRESLRVVVTLGGAMAVAGLLAAPLLAPLLEAVPKSKRYHELKANPPTAEVPYSDEPSARVLFQPHFAGQIPMEQTWGPADAESITGFAGFFGVCAWFALLANLVATRRWRTRETFFLLMTVFILGVILAWPGFSETFHLAFKLAANARLRLLFALLLSIQTAAAIDLLQRGGRRSVLLGILAGSAILLWMLQRATFKNAWQHDTAILAMLPSIAVLLLATIAALRGARVPLLATMIAIIAELWLVGSGWNPVVPEKWMYPQTPMLKKLAALRDAQPANAPFRIIGAGPMFFPNTSAMYGLEDVRAHDPMANGRYLGVLRVVAGYDTSDYFAKWNNFDTRLLDFLNVKYIVTPPKAELEDAARYEVVYDGKDGRLFENHAALPRFYAVRNVVLEFRDDLFVRLLREHTDYAHTALLETIEFENAQMRADLFAPRPADSPEASVSIVESTPTSYRVHVNAPRYSLIVSSIPWWPGWKVERNGARIDPVRVNGAFTAFVVPPGELDVRVWYDPWTFRLGAIVCGLTIVALIAIAVRRR